jgi:uncharacterized membrane protein
MSKEDIKEAALQTYYDRSVKLFEEMRNNLHNNPDTKRLAVKYLHDAPPVLDKNGEIQARNSGSILDKNSAGHRKREVALKELIAEAYSISEISETQKKYLNSVEKVLQKDHERHRTVENFQIQTDVYKKELEDKSSPYHQGAQERISHMEKLSSNYRAKSRAEVEKLVDETQELAKSGFNKPASISRAQATRVADEAFTKTANVIENTANKARNYAKGFVEDVNTKIEANKAAAQDPAKIKQLTGYIKAIEKIAKDNNAKLTKIDDYMTKSGVTNQTTDYNKSVKMAEYINNISREMLQKPPQSMSQSQKTFLRNIGNLANHDVRLANPEQIIKHELKDKKMTLEEVKSEELKKRNIILQAMGAKKTKPVISPETKSAATAIGSVVTKKLSEKGKAIGGAVTKFAKKQISR